MSLTYVLITPARNEEAHIEKTIQSVVSQTILPQKWVIVSDGSTDSTDDIVNKYTPKHDWIELLQMPEHRDRNFAAKSHCVNSGYQAVKDYDFGFVGNVDADISFGKDFFENLLDKFDKWPELGVGGTHYTEGTFHSFKDSYINVNHVNGQCQLFRRECFEKIGGYLPIKDGGIDWIAVTTARMKGWKTYSFGDRTYTHHRKMGTASSNVLKARFHYGKKDYLFGGHPLWQVFRGFFQMVNKPYIIGGLLLIAGYFWTWANRVESPVSKELMKFHRQEQMQRLKNLLSNGLKMNR